MRLYRILDNATVNFYNRRGPLGVNEGGRLKIYQIARTKRLRHRIVRDVLKITDLSIWQAELKAMNRYALS